MPATELVPLNKLCHFESSPGVTDCPTKAFARGYCEKHYRQLSRAGAFALDVKPKTDKAMVLHNVASVRRARKKLLKAMPSLMDDFVRGAGIAANQGKVEAIQWAILHTRTLEPVATQTNAPTTTGVVVNVGVKVAGTATEDK